MADEAAETDKAYLANEADVMRPMRPMWHPDEADKAEAVDKA